MGGYLEWTVAVILDEPWAASYRRAVSEHMRGHQGEPDQAPGCA